ncbi:MFS transporter [archaeon]|nr:MAG: MFS transporter [archaeon]
MADAFSYDYMDRRRDGEKLDLILQESKEILPTNLPLSQDHNKKKKTYVYLNFLCALYGIVFAITIPAMPAVSLQICQDNAAQAAYLYGIANFTRFALEFVLSPVTGFIADSWGRKPLFVLGFMVCGAEFILLSLVPSVPTLLATRAMAGIYGLLMYI